jgi:hypothetical protein
MSVTFFQIKKILESNKKIPAIIVRYLIKSDFLLNNITEILPGYTETPIYFEPTYKRNSVTGHFKLQKNKYGLCPVGRLPGYTDRIMIKTSLHTRNTLYDSIPMVGNDHFPVIFITQIYSISIAVLTWNIGSGKPEHICPNLLRRNFNRFGKKPDILIIGFQEADKYTIPNVTIWNDMYDSNIRLHGNSLQSLLGHIIGFGLETTILWDTTSVRVRQILQESNKGTVTKGVHTSKFKFSKNDISFTCSLANIHAPFTKDQAKYSNFYKSTLKYLNKLGNSDILLLFGDFNSRCMLKLTKYGSPLFIKDIRLNNKLTRNNIRKNISRSIKKRLPKCINKNSIANLDLTVNSPLYQHNLLQYNYSHWLLYFRLK